MNGRSTLLTLIILGCHAGLVSAQSFESKISLFSGDPKGSRAAGTVTHVGSPVVVANSGQHASYLVGSQVAVGGQVVPVGRQVHIIATDAGDGAILVNLTLENSELVGPKPAKVVSTKSQTTTTVQPGSKIRLELGNDPKNKLWVEVTISKVK